MLGRAAGNTGRSDRKKQTHGQTLLPTKIKDQRGRERGNQIGKKKEKLLKPRNRKVSNSLHLTGDQGSFKTGSKGGGDLKTQVREQAVRVSANQKKLLGTDKEIVKEDSPW